MRDFARISHYLLLWTVFSFGKIINAKLQVSHSGDRNFALAVASVSLGFFGGPFGAAATSVAIVAFAAMHEGCLYDARIALQGCK